jgi:hypothetical protein
MLKPVCGALLALTLVACADHASVPSPTTPSATPFPTPTPPPAPAPRIPGGLAGEEWKLTTRIVDVTGPNACRGGLVVGSTNDWWMLVSRSGTAVTFLYDIRNYPTDHTLYVGSGNGLDFTAISNDYTQVHPCGSVSFEWRSTNVSGRFSEDGGSLTATEVWSYTNTATGDTFSFSYSWVASRFEQ